MFHRILVPLDGSVRAEQAIPAAARIARAFKGTIILLCVVSPLTGSGKFRGSQAYPQAILEKRRAEAGEYLQALAASEQLAGLATEQHTAIGAAAPTLLDAVEALGVDLLVACRHGLSGFTHWGVGSVAYKLVHQCAVPLLLLPSGQAFAPAEQRQVRALVALDGSPFAEMALEPVAHFLEGLAQAGNQQGALLLLQVVGKPASYGRFKSRFVSANDAQVEEEARQQAEQYLAGVAKYLAVSDLAQYRLAVTTRVVTDPDVAKAIVHTAEQELADMIAMTTHGWGGVLHWALGSIMERVLHATRMPLFIFRPPQKGSQRTATVQVEQGHDQPEQEAQKG